MSKFKVGDRVKIRSWEDMVKEFGLTVIGSIAREGMLELVHRSEPNVTIHFDGDDTYAIQGDKQAKVSRYHKDKYDSYIATIEAVNKLFGKGKCEDKPVGKKQEYKVGDKVVLAADIIKQNGTLCYAVNSITKIVRKDTPVDKIYIGAGTVATISKIEPNGIHYLQFEEGIFAHYGIYNFVHLSEFKNFKRGDRVKFTDEYGKTVYATYQRPSRFSDDCVVINNISYMLDQHRLVDINIGNLTLVNRPRKKHKGEK